PMPRGLPCELRILNLYTCALSRARPEHPCLRLTMTYLEVGKPYLTPLNSNQTGNHRDRTATAAPYASGVDETLHTVGDRRRWQHSVALGFLFYCVKMRWIITSPAVDLKAIKADESMTLPLFRAATRS
ncbi:MAG: hypothetical protein JWQ49_3730, partial [Edaphobacter sp.]|nr:hypothetical protein [Edaphobacter sp.]